MNAAGALINAATSAQKEIATQVKVSSLDLVQFSIQLVVELCLDNIEKINYTEKKYWNDQNENTSIIKSLQR